MSECHLLLLQDFKDSCYELRLLMTCECQQAVIAATITSTARFICKVLVAFFQKHFTGSQGKPKWRQFMSHQNSVGSLSASIVAA